MPRCGGGGWNPANVILGASEAGVVAHNEVMSTRRAKRRVEARARSHNDVIMGQAVTHDE